MLPQIVCFRYSNATFVRGKLEQQTIQTYKANTVPLPVLLTQVLSSTINLHLLLNELLKHTCT